jgi:hypothetical protein
MTGDAQRDLEQRALRNVRGLVDKIESGDALDKRKQRKVLFTIFGCAVLLAAVIAIVLAWNARRDRVVIDPAKLPPVKAGPRS